MKYKKKKKEKKTGKVRQNTQHNTDFWTEHKVEA
jgi:regulation of enolase protein 1 (concanavalin A-like superfamily)